jgi:predicted RNA-binding Zn-ribbon protein involved in translation (DUF1610 family)
MSIRRRRQECPAPKYVMLICPNCGAIVRVPMCQAVNGEKITCTNCQKEFVLRYVTNLKNP